MWPVAVDAVVVVEEVELEAIPAQSAKAGALARAESRQTANVRRFMLGTPL